MTIQTRVENSHQHSVQVVVNRLLPTVSLNNLSHSKPPRNLTNATGYFARNVPRPMRLVEAIVRTQMYNFLISHLHLDNNGAFSLNLHSLLGP